MDIDQSLRLVDILAWPATFAILLFLFRSHIVNLIRWFKTEAEQRGVEAKIGSASVRLDVPQGQTPADESSPTPPEPELAPPAIQDEELTPARFQELKDLTEAALAQAWFYFFEYLSEYLKPHTQAVLRWLAGIPRGVLLTPPLVDTLVLPANAPERDVVIHVLVGRGLAAWEPSPGTQDQTLRVTETGLKFIVHMNVQHPEKTVLSDPNPPYAPRLNLAPPAAASNPIDALRERGRPS